jgi:hypothetical protein
MEKLAILDFESNEVHIYNIDSDYEPDIDDLLLGLGHNANMCQWMFGEDIKVVKHKGVLK